MSIGVYNKGDTRRLAAVFTNAAGSETDPDSVTLRITTPAGEVLGRTYNVGSPTEVVKSSAANYYFDLVLEQAGEWRWQWEGAGPVIAIEPGQCTVVGNGF